MGHDMEITVLIALLLALCLILGSSVSISASIGGKAISGTLTRADAATEIGTGTVPGSPLAAGNAGTLTTRTDDDTGVITASSADHDILNGDVVDVYWSGGLRRGMSVTAVAGTAISINLGAGTVLPALSTVVVVDKQVVLDVDATAAAIIQAAASAQRRASIQFQEAAGTPIASLDLGLSGVDGEAWEWSSDTAVATPFGADVGKIVISNGSSAGTNIINIGLALE